MVIAVTFSITACQQEDLDKAQSLFGEIAGDDISAGNDVAPVDEKKFEEQSAPVNVTENDAHDNAHQSLKTGLIPAVRKMLDHLDAVDGFLEDESSSEAAVTNSNPTMKAQGEAIHSLSKALAKISKRSSHDNNSEDTPIDVELSEFVDDFFLDLLTFHRKDGNIIIYKVSTKVCEDETDYSIDPGCEKLVNKIRVIQKLNSSNSGLIALKYEDFKPIAVGYSPDEWFIQTNLAEVKGVVDAITSAASIPKDEQLSLPSTFKGVIRVTLKNIDADSMSAALGILEPIRVIEPGEVDVKVGKGRLIKISVDEAAQTFNAKISSGALEAMFIETDEDTDIETKMAFAISSITGEMVIDGTADTISINGLQLGSGGFVAKANGQEMMRVTASDVNAIVSLGDKEQETNDIIQVTTALDVKLVYNLVEGVNDDEFAIGFVSNSIHVTAPAATEVEMSEIEITEEGTSNIDTHEVIKVIAGGPVNLVVTGEDAANINLELDTCYDMDVDGPPEVVTCP